MSWHLASGWLCLCEYFMLGENKIRAAQKMIFHHSSRLQEVRLGLLGVLELAPWQQSLRQLKAFSVTVSIQGRTFISSTGILASSASFSLVDQLVLQHVTCCDLLQNWPTEARAVCWDNTASMSLRSKMPGHPFSDKNLQFVFILLPVD